MKSLITENAPFGAVLIEELCSLATPSLRLMYGVNVLISSHVDSVRSAIVNGIAGTYARRLNISFAPMPDGPASR